MIDEQAENDPDARAPFREPLTSSDVGRVEKDPKRWQRLSKKNNDYR